MTILSLNWTIITTFDLFKQTFHRFKNHCYKIYFYLFVEYNKQHVWLSLPLSCCLQHPKLSSCCYWYVYYYLNFLMHWHAISILQDMELRKLCWLMAEDFEKLEGGEGGGPGTSGIFSTGY